MPALHHLTIQGFKSITAIEKLVLKQINVVIGPNGSGKSNFIEVFSLFSAISEGRLQTYVSRSGGANRLLHFGEKSTSKIHLHASFDGMTNGYEIDLVAANGDRLRPAAEFLSFVDIEALLPGERSMPFLEFSDGSGWEAGISGASDNEVVVDVRDYLAGWKVYHFHDTSRSAPMKKTANLNDNHSLRADGANLAAFLYLLCERHADAYGLIRRAIQRVAPFFDDFILQPQRLNPDKILLEWKHKNSEEYFDASSLSDGTLRFMALATLLLQPEQFRPPLILIDEPELGLHPLAITMLASAMRTASQASQLIVSTQSSLLLDQFEPPEVLVAEREEGGTRLRRLEEAGLAEWLDEYSLGQLWEKNVLGGRPGPG